MHVGALFSEDDPAGNAAGSMGHAMDPATGVPITRPILWDSNVLRGPPVEAVDRSRGRFVTRYPRAAFPELKAHPASDPDAFREWAMEGHQVAVDWAFGVETTSDPNQTQTSEQLVENMVEFILNGVSPVDEAPSLPAGYWEKLQTPTAGRLSPLRSTPSFFEILRSFPSLAALVTARDHHVAGLRVLCDRRRAQRYLRRFATCSSTRLHGPGSSR